MLNEYTDSKEDIFEEPNNSVLKTGNEIQNYEDFISKSTSKIMNLDNEFFLNQISSRKSYIILELLRSTPKTIKEIHSEFIDYCEKNSINDPKIKKIRENSLYKNIIALKKNGLIIEAGRRIYPGKSCQAQSDEIH